jgi:hypothetical protein
MKTLKFTVKEEELINFKRRRYVRSFVARAVASGKLQKKASCELCSERCCTQAHHTDYGQPLKVVWLCRKCHGLVHTKDHPLNPDNNPQTPLPDSFSRYKRVSVSFTLPIANYIALQREADKMQKPLSSLVRDEALKKYPVDSGQLEFQFTEDQNDQPSQVENERIQSLAKDEVLLPKPKSTLLPKVRGKRNLNLQGVDGGLLKLPSRYGTNTRRV